MPSQINVMFKDGTLQQMVNSQYLMDGLAGTGSVLEMQYLEELMSMSRLKNYKDFMEDLKQTNKQIK